MSNCLVMSKMLTTHDAIQDILFNFAYVSETINLKMSECFVLGVKVDTYNCMLMLQMMNGDVLYKNVRERYLAGTVPGIYEFDVGMSASVHAFFDRSHKMKLHGHKRTSRIKRKETHIFLSILKESLPMIPKQ